MLGIDTLSYWAALFLPMLFWSAYHYYKDRHRPEPIAILLMALVLGYCSAYISQVMYESLDVFGLRYDAYALAQESSWALLAYSLLAIGPIEELAKFIPFIVIAVRQPHFDEPLDGVIYASFIALGFSINENQDYLAYMQGWEAVARGIASPIVHVMFASIWGYAYGYADIHSYNRAGFTFLALVASMILHGIYDFFSIGLSLWAHVVPPAIILAIWLWRMHSTKDQTQG